jgi:hypothetical protein
MIDTTIYDETENLRFLREELKRTKILLASLIDKEKFGNITMKSIAYYKNKSFDIRILEVPAQMLVQVYVEEK